MAKKKSYDVSKIDARSILNGLGVYFTEAGAKNVSNGWLGTTCPYCHDKSNHMGIHVESKMCHCFLCGKDTNLLKMIFDSNRMSWKQIFQLANTHLIDPELRVADTYERESMLAVERCVFPSNVSRIPYIKAEKYLEKRNYDPELLEYIYGIRYTGKKSIITYKENEWDYSKRILCPVYENGRVVCFVARDYTEKADEKYKNSPVQTSVKAAKSCWYNLDTVTDTAILVEGITDVWRIGDGAIASLGKAVSSEQINMLVKKKVERVVILFDADAEDTATALSDTISIFIPTEIAYLDSGDPGELSDDEARYIRKELMV